jgi:hypothetical protein
MSQHVSIAVALVLVIVLTSFRGSSQCTLNQLQIPSDERLAINDTLTHTFVSAIEVSRPVLVEVATTLVSPNEIILVIYSGPTSTERQKAKNGLCLLNFAFCPKHTAQH